MKKIIYIAIVLFDAHLSFCQCDSKGITTNPDAPTNTERPSKKNTFFDWRTQFYQVNSANIAATQIESPFFQGYQNSNVEPLYTIKDMKPQDGWELINFDMGFNENGTAKNPPTDYVYLILYNKYTGVLRVFLAGDRPQSFNGAQIQISFTGPPDTQKYTSLLSNASKLFALDRFEANPKITAVSPYLNGLGKWFYADFQMTYDACTCFYDSKIVVKVFLLSTADVKIDGSFTGTIATITNNVGTVENNGFSVKDIVAAGQKAQKSYNSVASFVSDQEKALGIEGKTNLQLNIEQLFKRNSLNDFQQELKKSSFLKAGLKAAPFIAAAVDLVDFFVGGGSSSSGVQEVSIKPMSINATINLKGTITNASLYRDIFFNVPGSKDAQIKDEKLYPYYNEVLGVFNLMSTPKGYRKRVTGFVSVTDWFVMAENIKYVLNPAAGYKPEDVEIQANLIFKQINRDGTESLIADTGYLPISVINNFSSAFDATSGAWIPGYRAFDKVYLKLLINLTRLDTDSNKQNTLFVLNYSVDLTENANAYFPTSVFTGGEKDVVYQGILSNNFLARGWRSASLIAESTMSANSRIVAGYSFLNGPSYIPPALPAEISSFCNTAYRDEPFRNFRVAGKDDPEKEQGIKSNLDVHLTAFPNPTTGKVSFRYYVEEPSQVRLNLISTTGSVVATPVDAYQEAGPYEFAYDASNLPAGIYIYTLETSKGKETKRLVVIR